MTVPWRPLMTVAGLSRPAADGPFTLLLDPYGVYVLRAEDAPGATEHTLRGLLRQPPNVFVAYEDILDLPYDEDVPRLTLVSTKGDFALDFPPDAADAARAVRAEALKRRPAR